MRKQYWPKRDPIKNYFPFPNEIFSLGLSAGAIAVYGFLLHREDRRTYQCVASYRNAVLQMFQCGEMMRRHLVSGPEEYCRIFLPQYVVPCSKQLSPCNGL